MDRHSLTTHQAFDVQNVADDVHITAMSPIVSVRDDDDGSGTRPLHRGATPAGRWRFLIPAARTGRGRGAKGSSRCVITELEERIDRVVSNESGIDFIHQSCGPAAP